jgi:hypothetical protein
MTRILACLCLAGIAALSPVRAADCTTLEQMHETVLAAGGRIAGAADYAGAVTDTTIIVETGSAIMLLGFKGGCFVGAIVIEPQIEAKPLT